MENLCDYRRNEDFREKFTSISMYSKNTLKIKHTVHLKKNGFAFKGKLFRVESLLRVQNS